MMIRNPLANNPSELNSLLHHIAEGVIWPDEDAAFFLDESTEIWKYERYKLPFFVDNGQIYFFATDITPSVREMYTGYFDNLWGTDR
jgi:hypothetical protein